MLHDTKRKYACAYSDVCRFDVDFTHTIEIRVFSCFVSSLTPKYPGVLAKFVCVAVIDALCPEQELYRCGLSMNIDVCIVTNHQSPCQDGLLRSV